MAVPLLMEREHYVKGIDPVADAFAGTVRSDVVNMSLYHSVEFILHKGDGATGTSTITVEASDDVVPTNVTAIPFRYRAITSTDIEGAIQQAAAAGFATTAGSSQLYIIEVSADDVGKTGYKYVSLKAVEVVDSPVLGGILIKMGHPRYAEDIKPTAIV